VELIQVDATNTNTSRWKSYNKIWLKSYNYILLEVIQLVPTKRHKTRSYIKSYNKTPPEVIKQGPVGSDTIKACYKVCK